MNQKNMKNSLVVASALLYVPSGLYADNVTLGAIEVTQTSEKKYQNSVSYTASQETAVLAQTSSGETLGDYLSNQPNVHSASYGPAVGRPTVRGMEGYRVGIAQGGVMLNDLSAMSQDHAVGLNARTTERIEMIKGPASLLYGAYSGGVIRVLGEEHDKSIAKKPTIDATLSTNSNTKSTLTDIKTAYGNGNWGGNLGYYSNNADDYTSGGEKIKNSDLSDEQFHGVFGWQVTPQSVVKLYGDRMDKAYAIPNTTIERTDILMEQNRYGIVAHTQTIGALQNLILEYQKSDYRHYERESGRYDGLFDQQQQSLSTQFDLNFDNTDAHIRIEAFENALKVCHEHGECRDFAEALRTDSLDGFSLLNYYNDRGIAFSHGHPMPNTDEKKLQIAVNLQHYDDANEYSVALNTTARRITPDSDNIQETWLMPQSLDRDYYDKETGGAVSFSVGWWREWTQRLNSQISLAYLERLSSAQELFWNGFHHATDSYILGDRDLGKERSVNLDVDVLFKHTEAFSSRVSGYYYDFANYLYQSPMADANGVLIHDPFHLSQVWQMRGVGARIYGAGVEETYQTILGLHEIKTSLGLNLLKGELKDGGYIPRMTPYNVTLSLEHNHMGFVNTVTLKWMDKSRFLAQNETPTASYTMLNLSTHYTYSLAKGSLELWLKGQNLTDVVARNHLSFLKETAPLEGRAWIAGVKYHY